MDTVPLQTQARVVDLKPKALRREGSVPVVLYGNNVENTALQCTSRAIQVAFKKAGASTLVDLEVDGKNVPVLFHSVDKDPVSGLIIHADFYAVDMKKEIEAHVPIHLVDESPAVKDFGGVLLVPNDTVTVRCLPANLPHSLDLSVSALEEIGSHLSVSDLPLPDGVVVTDDPATVLATVHEQRAEIIEEVAEDEEGEEGEGGEGGDGEGDSEESGESGSEGGGDE